jgi:hypothetical protein
MIPDKTKRAPDTQTIGFATESNSRLTALFQNHFEIMFILIWSLPLRTQSQFFNEGGELTHYFRLKMLFSANPLSVTYLPKDILIGEPVEQVLQSQLLVEIEVLLRNAESTRDVHAP